MRIRKRTTIRHFFDAGTFQARDLPNHQLLDWEGLRGRLRSSSYAPTEDHRELRAHDGGVAQHVRHSPAKWNRSYGILCTNLFWQARRENSMKVAYNWLKEFVDLTASPDELASRLALCGHQHRRRRKGRARRGHRRGNHLQPARLPRHARHRARSFRHLPPSAENGRAEAGGKHFGKSE